MSQKEAVLAHLLTGATITPYEGLRLFGSLRLSERIRELEAEGVSITHTMVKVGDKHVCQYKLAIPH